MFTFVLCVLCVCFCLTTFSCVFTVPEYIWGGKCESSSSHVRRRSCKVVWSALLDWIFFFGGGGFRAQIIFCSHTQQIQNWANPHLQLGVASGSGFLPAGPVLPVLPVLPVRLSEATLAAFIAKLKLEVHLSDAVDLNECFYFLF